MLHDYEVDLTGVGNMTIIVCMCIVFLVIDGHIAFGLACASVYDLLCFAAHQTFNTVASRTTASFGCVAQ